MRKARSYPKSKPGRRIDVATWIIAILSCIMLAALFAAGRGALLRMAIPAAASCIALSLIYRRPAGYLEFVLWTWILTPFLRRVVDWRVGFADQNLVLLTPFLVSGVAVLGFRKSKGFHQLRIAPFLFCAVGIAYGFVVGMAIHPSGEVIYGLVDWLSPMLLGLHIYVHWEDLEANSAVLKRVALLGLLVVGIYGIVQFYRPPIWDTEWLTNLPGGIESSTFGRPEPEQIRVWSTLNAPGPFANVAVALLFFVIPAKSKLKLPAIAAGLYSVMLSLVRTAWITGVVGFLYFARSSNKKLFAKCIVLLGVALISVIALANSSLNIPIIEDRVKSLGDLKDDESVQDRVRLYEGLSLVVLNQPVGIGLNNADFYDGYPLDSGAIRMLLNLGWFGTLIYSIGILKIVSLLYSNKNRQSTSNSVCKAIVATFLFQLLSGLVFIGASGAMFWLAVGTAMASAKEPVYAAEREARVELFA